MQLRPPGVRASRPHPARGGPAAAALIVLALLLASFLAPAAAQEANLGFSPASGHAQVIAQGVVELPQGDVVWRTVRTRAALPADANFEARPLGFVLASMGPVLLVDSETGEQVHLGTGEAALVKSGALQQRSSLSDEPVSYLSIELVPVDAEPPADAAVVLQPGQPFSAPAGLRDLDLVSDTLAAGETFTIPDSGAKNVVLITDGAANVGRPGNEPVVLLAGEAASFSGELQVAATQDGAGPVSFVVAMIGPELPTAVALSPEPNDSTPTPVTASDVTSGTITVEVFTCPPGMTADTLAAAACAPATVDFDVTLSSAEIDAPLTLAEATPTGDAFSWGPLPFGEYVIAEAFLPAGFESYVLSAINASGTPDAGYRIAITPEQPDVTARIYNFAAP